MDVEVLRGIVGVETEAAERGLRDVTRAFDEAGRGADVAGRQFDSASMTSGALGEVLGAAGLSLSLGGVAAGLLAVGKSSFQLAAEMEQNMIAFETLIGSTEAAQAHLDELREFAATTPFEFRDLTDVSKKMQALGFEAEQVIPMLTVLGDASAALGLGSEGINRMTIALGQMQAKGKASGEELLQLTEAGIPAMRYLAESAGVTQAEMAKMVEKGLVPADQAIQAILAGAREDFGGLMAAQADTATTALSNLQDAWDTYQASIGQGLQDPTKGIADWGAGILRVQTEINEALFDGAAGFGNGAGLIELYYSAWLGYMGDSEQAMERINALMAFYERQQAGVTTSNTEFNDSGALMVTRLIELGGGFSALPGPIDATTSAMADAKAETDAWKAKLGELRSFISSSFGRSLEDYREKQGDLLDQQEDLRQQIDDLTQSNGAYYETIQGNGLSSNELALAQARLADAQAKLAQETDPVKQAQLNVEIDKQAALIAGADRVVGGYIDNSGRISDLQGKYEDLTETIEDNAEAHRIATGKFIYDMFVRKAEADGVVTQAEEDFLVRVPAALGIMDQATVDSAVALGGIFTDYVQNGMVDEAIDKTLQFRDAIGEIPDEKVVTIRVEGAGLFGDTDRYDDPGGGGGGGSGGSDGDDGGGDDFVPEPGGPLAFAQETEAPSTGLIGPVNFYISGVDDPQEIGRMVMRYLADRGLIPQQLV